MNHASSTARRRKPVFLSIELLEDRNPASTSLDWLLASLWLTSPVASVSWDKPMPQRTENIGVDHSMSAAWQSSPVGRESGGQSAPDSRSAAFQSADRNHTESNHGLSQALENWADLGLDLPVRDDQAFILPAPAVQRTEGLRVEGSTVAVKRTATGSPLSIDTPTIELASKDDALVPVRAAAPRAASMMLDNPTISLTPATTFIPVNANRTSMSPWQVSVATTLPPGVVGVPVVRDFDLAPMRNLAGWDGIGSPPGGPAIVDPELKQMTATVTPNGHSPMGPIRVFVIYSDPDNNGGGWIRLWKDQSKTEGIFLTHDGNGVFSGTLPNWPTSDFYVEGIRPSKTIGDVKLKVQAHFMAYPQWYVVHEEKDLTVTPIVDSFSVNPKVPDTATFIKDINGNEFGISSGEQPDGGSHGATKAGVQYEANLYVKGIDGEGWFLQNVQSLLHGDPAVELSNGNRYNPSFGGAVFPLLDHVPPPLGGPMPFYATKPGAIYDENRKMIVSLDTPGLGSPTLFTGQLDMMDATFQARMYVVWKFPDGALFTLAYANWQAVFQSTHLDHDPILLATSVVSANPMVLSHVNPRILGPTYNALVNAAGFWVQV